MLSKYGGNLGSSGCVSYLFEKRGVLTLRARRASTATPCSRPRSRRAPATSSRAASRVEVVTAPGDLDAVRATLEAAGFAPASAEVSMEPSTTVKLEGEDAESMLRLADALDDLDDVQAVYANFDISEEEMARLA